MRILIACEESGRVCEAFRNKGHDAFSCDIIETSGHLPQYHIVNDVLPLLNGGCFFTLNGDYYHMSKWDMIIAFPPCTNLCVTGNRWFSDGTKPYKLRLQAIAFFYRFVMANCDRIAIENPVGVMSTAYRPPDQIIHPYMFGDPVAKKTCLWLKGLPPLIKTYDVKDKVEYHIMKDGSKMSKWYYDAWNKPKQRAELRSKTFPGIAAAMADQWG